MFLQKYLYDVSFLMLTHKYVKMCICVNTLAFVGFDLIGINLIVLVGCVLTRVNTLVLVGCVITLVGLDTSYNG